MRTFLFTLLLLPFLSNAQNIEDRIKTIRKWYSEIESETIKYKQLVYQEIEDSNYVMGGSSELTVFLDTVENNITKIVEHTYYDWAETEITWYFHKDSCFFIFDESNGAKDMYSAEELGISEDELWQRGGEVKTINYYENRLYFNSKGICIQHLNKDIIVPAEETIPDMADVPNTTISLEGSYAADLRDHGIFLRDWIMKKQ